MIPTLSDALAKQGYTDLTPVQIAVTDAELEGKDLLVSAQTGSGKTVGFGLAIGPTILAEDGTFGPAGRPLALVIAPTRELALQVKRELQWLYAGAGATLASCVGGMDFRDERRSLERGAHIVVATPGRLRDHIMRGTIDLSDIKAVVLDEADEMLDLGFREDLEFILDQAPETRRTLMFSATVPKMIATLAKSYQRDAVRVATVTKESQHSDIEYRALSVANHDIDAAIINALRYYDAPNAIVFANTRAMVTRLTTRLANRGFATVALSGELSQTERSHALQAMRDGRAKVCVATDVAARGIDLPNLELVIHAELPTNAETLLHRSGRTGRAGRKGISALIVPAKMKRRAENLLKWGKLTATWAMPPTAEEVTAKDEERLLTDPVWAEEFTDSETEFAKRLLAAHAPEKIAAAYLRLYAGKQSAPEHISEYKEGPQAKERTPRETKSFGPSRWFSVDVGREGKAEARWLLPMICKAGGITKNEIGAIRIQPNETFVEISEPAVQGFLKSVGKDMKLENQATLTALGGPPQLGEKGPRKTKRDYDKPKGVRNDGPKPERHAPRDQSPPPPSRQNDEPAIKPIPGAADDKSARKPRAKPARRDHGDALVEKKKPAFKGKKPGKQNTSGFKSDTSGHKSGGGKPAGKPAAKPAGNAKDTSKRFVPPGGKSKPRKGLGKGGHGAPRRGKS
ncbi:ATP-dependent RNA helicase DeaD [Yoonia sediminilitoris]|uniref:ATP-dependent RNA helicase DeaD n=2 Tax=Yoonia sediminilitoris TaxID=1286148 RepID=A0A2T6KCW6_9RHOB|nr:DEAD/DEAH box helicase [Yoonia sediminilitoris]PUB12770.1 ATP-dependent RNA helicase DeaD [Yoonia sediminilitoris]RCW94249.1 ATP-dependent RNA helicase DeaD [Yoonia sediminilitoris]